MAIGCGDGSVIISSGTDMVMAIPRKVASTNNDLIVVFDSKVWGETEDR